MQTQSTHHPGSNGFTCSGWVDVSGERDRLNVIVGIVGYL